MDLPARQHSAPHYDLTDDEVEQVRAAADAIPFTTPTETPPHAPDPGPLEISRVQCDYVSIVTGIQCRRQSRLGLTRCNFHDEYGAATALVRDAVQDYARRGLYELTPDAIAVIESILNNEEVNPAVRLKAATETLDRIGVRAGTEVTVNVEVEMVDPAEEIRARLARLADSVPAVLERAEIVDVDVDADVEDAELVEEAEEFD